MCEITGCNQSSALPPISISKQQRRLFLKGLATLPLASVLAYPELAQAAAGSTHEEMIELADGSTVRAAMALPEANDAPAVLLIHEWWGLNDQIKVVAAELAKQGYIALAVDLYDGGVATTPDEARGFMKAVDKTQATQTLSNWINLLKEHKQGNGKVATLGWCFGGGWSVNASIAAPVDATVVYYGNVTQSAEQLAKLNGPVLGHFATLDKRINQEMVSGFEAQMQAANKSDQLDVHWYEADHAFANPTGARYDEADAALAWERTMAFFQQHLA